MKQSHILSLIAAVVVVAGCSTTHHHGAPAPAATSTSAASDLDTSSLVAAFKNADNTSNQLVQGVVSALSKKDYAGALSSLQSLSRIPGLTASQADSVHGLLAGISAKSK